MALVYPDYDRVSQESMDENDLAKLMEEKSYQTQSDAPLIAVFPGLNCKNEFEKTPKDL